MLKKLQNATLKLQNVRQITDMFHNDQMQDTSEFDDYMARTQQSRATFTDPKFGAVSGSLATTWKSLASNQQIKWKSFKWLRAKHIFQNKVQIFQDKIEPNDIKQGGLGDCYFLSALSVLAEKPELVMQLFHERTINEQGIFSVWMNANGEWLNVVVDDQFPCVVESSQPAFSKAHGEELWVMVLEKAYAKMYGTYQRIEGGNPAMALRDLTGAPYENKDECTVDELWDYLWVNYQQGFLLTCYTKSTTSKEEENKVGILSGHAYAILQMASVVDQRKKPARILKPWGKVEWNGAWADHSAEWTPALKKQLQLDDVDDGIFWISVGDFRQYYEGVGVCKVHPTYVYNSLKLDLTTPSVVYLEVRARTHCYVSVDQVDERFYFGKPHEYAYVRILVAQLLPQNAVRYVTGQYAQNRNVSAEATLDEGHYAILISVEWVSEGTRSMVCSSYSAESVQLQRCTGVDALLLQKYIFRDYALNNSVKLVSYKAQHNLDIEKRIGTQWGALFFHYRNGTADVNLVEKVTFSDLTGYRLLAPFMLNDQVLEFTLTPGHEMVVMFTQIPTTDGEYSYSYKTSTTLPRQNQMDKYDDDRAYLTAIQLTNLTLEGNTGRSQVTLNHFQADIMQVRPSLSQPGTNRKQDIMIESRVVQQQQQAEKSPGLSPGQSSGRVSIASHHYNKIGEKIFIPKPTEVEIYEVEQEIVQMIDGIAAGRSMSIAFFVVYGVSTLLTCFTSLKMPSMCALTVISVLLGCILTNTLNRSVLRYLMVLQVVAMLQTLMFVCFANDDTQFQQVSAGGWAQSLTTVVELVGLVFQALSLLLMVRMMVKYGSYEEELRKLANLKYIVCFMHYISILILEERIDSHI